MRKISRKIRIAVSCVLIGSTCGMLAGCQTDKADEVPVDEMPVTVELTETVPESESESGSEAIPETIPETEPEAETIPETIPETEPEAEAIPETIPETEPEAEAIPTNAEVLQMIINAFGMLSDGTFEGNFKEASAWDIVDADAVLSPDDAVTAEFLISASMRATGLVTGSASMDEILACAVEKGVIASQDLSAVDPASAEEIVEKAKYAWTHPEFSNSVDEGGGVTLQDNVIDLSESIPADAVQINGEEITIPTEYAEKITENSIVIFPGEKGGAYKIQKIGETDGATVIINAVPAQFEEVYQSIHVSY